MGNNVFTDPLKSVDSLIAGLFQLLVYIVSFFNRVAKATTTTTTEAAKDQG